MSKQTRKKKDTCPSRCRLGRHYMPKFRDPKEGETGDKVLDIVTLGFCKTHNRSLAACIALEELG